MRVFLTGGTGFIGGAVARQLRDLGHEVVALVRTPETADDLRRVGAELVEGDLSTADGIAYAAHGCDVAVHGAAIYRIGVTAAEAEELRRTNVAGTEHALEGLTRAGVEKIVHVSTVGVFGDTRGAVVDESYERDPAAGFLSVYDETKYRAHQIALEHLDAGAPIVIVQPAAVYGPRDHSEIGATLVRAAQGKLPASALTTLGLSMVHVDDVAAGIILALEKGVVGERYILSGERATMGELIKRAAILGGRKPPRFTVPTRVLKLISPAGPVLAPVLGMPKNLKEAVAASDGVTYYASHAKATAELDYRPRSITDGLASALT
ncbi:MAG: NAD-dependent epimerase/dehydratase family protein [Solirubrobacteraceae bacterium]|nr:NAD-dependent epimerase/dehydratase family protein [Solirubrobacteraceae bacterium]